MAVPQNRCTTTEQRGVVRFVWANIWQQRISTKKCCPCTVNIACHVKQSTIGCRSSRKDGQVSQTNIVSVGLRSNSNHKNFTPQFPGTYETVGQVFKFVWRLCWKINVVCTYVIISIRLFSITICNLLIEFPSYVHLWWYRAELFSEWEMFQVTFV